jgi:hypothetical protein
MASGLVSTLTVDVDTNLYYGDHAIVKKGKRLLPSKIHFIIVG